MAERYTYEISNPKETGFTVVSCTDNVTGIIVRTPIVSDKVSFSASVAYVGAKFSRSREGMEVLMGEVFRAYGEGKLIPEQRLATIVNGLKHQSPAGMAHVTVAMEKIPIATAAKVFRSIDLGDGQEASTRFINFESGNDLPNLKILLPGGVEISEELMKKYLELQNMSLSFYRNKWYPIVYEAYKNHFKVDENNKREVDALNARTLDTVRGFLLSGFKTSMILVANATTMQQLIGELGADRLPGEKQLADALLVLLRPEGQYVPEIKSLLNHTEPNLRTKEEQNELMKFLVQQPGFDDLLKRRRHFRGLVDNSCEFFGNNVNPTDRIVAQYIVTVYPSLVFTDAIAFANSLNNTQRAEFGRIIFSRRDRFNLPSVASSVGTIGLDMNVDYGIERDLGRHRAWRRLSPIHETHLGLGEIADTGFTQVAYLREIPEFAEIQKGMEMDMKKYYEKRNIFLGELTKVAGQETADRVGMYLLPLAHQVEMFMNGDARYMVHFQDIRIRPGAHIDARLVVASANRQLTQRDALYSSMQYPDGTVNPKDRDQFIRRD